MVPKLFPKCTRGSVQDLAKQPTFRSRQVLPRCTVQNRPIVGVGTGVLLLVGAPG